MRGPASYAGNNWDKTKRLKRASVLGIRACGSCMSLSRRCWSGRRGRRGSGSRGGILGNGRRCRGRNGRFRRRSVLRCDLHFCRRRRRCRGRLWERLANQNPRLRIGVKNDVTKVGTQHETCVSAGPGQQNHYDYKRENRPSLFELEFGVGGLREGSGVFEIVKIGENRVVL